MSTPPLHEILAKITATEPKLKRAEDKNDTDRISLWENLLIKQQETLNILMAREAPSSASSAGGVTYYVVFLINISLGSKLRDFSGAEPLEKRHKIDVDPEIAIQRVIDSSLYITVKDATGNAVAISALRALTSLHGIIPVGSAVTFRDIHGCSFNATVGFAEFAKDNVDIAVLELDPSGPTFQTWTPVTLTPVRLTQEISVVGLQETMHGETEILVEICTVRCIERRAGSTLFQSTYYSALRFLSGAGVVTVVKDGWHNVVGVHIASHHKTEGIIDHGMKATVARLAEEDMKSITSELHGHTAYCLICEVQCVSTLVDYLNT